MENYLNECLEYQESIKVGLISGYKSDWPGELEGQPVAPTEVEDPSAPEVMDESEDLGDTDMPDDVNE